MPTLTKKQKALLEYLKKYIEKKGFSPTFDEIKKHFRLSSIATVHEHIKGLADKGFIKKQDLISRGIEIIEEDKTEKLEIPVLGTIAAGQPIEAVEVPSDYIEIQRSEVQETQRLYALKVQGSSMVDEGIFDGDIVIIKKQETAENGQTVVAIIDDNEATLKKLYREKDGFRLQPANQDILPFFRKEVEIRGIVIKIISKKVASNSFRTLDLFAGVGGIRLGFENAGFTTVFANDFDRQCKNTYDLNHKTSKLIVEDIRKLEIEDLPEFDFLLGGFPCQAFSIAGYRQGFSDGKGRGNLFFDVARIIEARKPTGFLLENVKNLTSHDNGKTFKIIIKTLEDLGYHIKSKVLNSMEYGNIPQNRERIYIIGFRDKKYIEKFAFPEPQELKVSVQDLLEDNVDKKYYYNDKPLYSKLKDSITEEGKVYQWRRRYVRENKKGVCPTLTANMGTGGHNVPIVKDSKGIRKLTPLECFRIQGFPRNFMLPKIADSSLYKQAGNSVSVPVIEAIAQKIMDALES